MKCLWSFWKWKRFRAILFEKAFEDVRMYVWRIMEDNSLFSELNGSNFSRRIFLSREGV